MHYCVALLVIALLAEGSSAWSLNSSGSTNRNINRRDACHTLLISTCATFCNSAGLPTLPANADVTNKVASSTAIRSLSRAQSQLKTKVLPPAQSNNYQGVKTALREPPFDTIRKDMLTLVRGGEDGPLADKLLLAYKQLIKAVETLDATASTGMGRGRGKVDPFQMSLDYENIEKALDLFIALASEAAGIPLQDDGGQKMRIGSIDSRSGEVFSRVI